MLAASPLLAATASSAGLLIVQAGLFRVFRSAPQLKSWSADAALPQCSLTVVIPAFNEAGNIQACLGSVLRSHPPCSDWSVVVVDDSSSDQTVDLARRTAAEGADRCSVLQAGPRPDAERWVGKNWACTRAMEQVTSEWVLFLDADVRLQPDALRRALRQAIDDGSGLFSLAPRLECDCLAEWMVQPIMASLLGLGFPIEAANDPTSDVASLPARSCSFRARPMTRSVVTGSWPVKLSKIWRWRDESRLRDFSCPIGLGLMRSG